MSRRPPPMEFEATPNLKVQQRRAVTAGSEPPPDTEMLSARVNGVNARRFRAYAKMKGETVQLHLDRAIADYLERNRL
jgi:hypothetical protein